MQPASDMSITLSEHQTRREAAPIDGMYVFLLGADSLSMSVNNVWHMDIDDESGISNAIALSLPP